MGLGHWLSNAAATAGKAAESMNRFAQDPSGVISIAAAVDPSLTATIQLPPDLTHTVKQFAAAGAAICTTSQVLSAAVQSIPKNVDPNGFSVAIRLMQDPVTEADIERVRAELPPSARLSFDMGVSAHIGQTAHTPPPGPPAVQAAYLMTKGVQGATVPQKEAIVGAIAANPDARPGAVLAIKDVAAARAATTQSAEGGWGGFMLWLGLR